VWSNGNFLGPYNVCKGISSYTRRLVRWLRRFGAGKAAGAISNKVTVAFELQQKLR